MFPDITNETIFQWSVVIVASLAAAAFDLRTRHIPNILTGPLLLSGLIWSGWHGGLAGLGDAAAACAVLAVPFVFMFLFCNGGAGDAKLMAGIGAWLGLAQSVVT